MFSDIPGGRRLICIALALTGAVLTPAAAQGETFETLSERATDFELIDIRVPIERPATFEIELPIDGETEVVTLNRVEIWAPGARVKVYGADGKFETIAPPTPNTYRGTIPGQSGSVITGGILPDGFHGIIRIPGREALELIPIEGTEQHALIDATASDEPPMTCDEPTEGMPAPLAGPRPPRLTDGVARLPGGGGGAPRGTTAAAVELAIEADVEYFNVYGNVTLTLDAMAIIVGNINPAYESAASLTHVLTAAIVRTAEPDPYSSNIGATLNQQQVDEWTTNQSDLPYDMVLLYTGKDTCSTSDPGDLCTLAGRVFDIGVVCDRSRAFAFTEFYNSTVTHAQIAGHELGHLWNARHCDSDSSSSCFGVTPCKLMCSTINGCDNTGTVDFATCNAGVVSSYRAGESCFTGGPNGVQWVEWRSCSPSPCIEIGSFVFPYNTVFEAVNLSLPGGFVIIKAGSSSQSGGNEALPLIINTPVELHSFDGAAIIGA